MDGVKIISADCINCGHSKKHEILFSVEKRTSDEEAIYIENTLEFPNDIPTEHIDKYLIVQCRGCENISFIHDYKMFADNDTEEMIHLIDQYPSQYRRSDNQIFLSEDNLNKLPSSIRNLYEEVEEAFEAESCILAGLGLRTLVEALCIQQQINGKNLQDKIKELENKRLISIQEAPILDKLRLIGNSSAHKIKSLPLDQLEYALGILNHILVSIYILQKITKRIKI